MNTDISSNNLEEPMHPCIKKIIVGIALLTFLAPLLTSAQVAIPDTELLRTTGGSEATRSVPFLTAVATLENQEYIEREYLVSGTANIYDYVDNASLSPLVQVVEAGLPYTTRIVIRRPRKRNRFNGTVYLDILNATRGFDSDVTWQYTAQAIIDEGAVYVGMTSKANTINWLRDEFGEPPLKERNASRYATLLMTNNGQVWDMLSQTAALIKAEGNPANPLSKFNVERIILTGYSQSAGYVKTYLNSFHRDAILADGRHAIDGYFEGAGSFGAKTPNPLGATGEFNPGNDPRNKSILPVPAPVIRFQTETEVNTFFQSIRTRQTEADSPMVRNYEMAGGAHVDAHLVQLEVQQNQDELGIDTAVECDPPPTTLRTEYIHSALLVRLDRWLRNGTAPPPSRQISLFINSNGKRVIEKDANGNTVGGVRMPQLDVPTGEWSGVGPNLYCVLGGSYLPYSDEEIAAKYPRRSIYQRKMYRAIRKVYTEGFLLPRAVWELYLETKSTPIGRGSRESNRNGKR
jgi:hypothetical protein